MKNKINLYYLISGLLIVLFASCSKTQSYSELLRDEEQAVNWYLASQKVEIDLPADSVSFIIGKDAPFYKLDEDGYVYMQIVSRDENADRVKEGDIVYFRFMRENIRFMYEGVDQESVGNSDYPLLGSTNFIYKNTYLTSSTQYGTGIQMPLKYVGYNSEVNLVLKSYYGFLEDQTYCYPYLINIRYFKGEY